MDAKFIWFYLIDHKNQASYSQPKNRTEKVRGLKKSAKFIN